MLKQLFLSELLWLCIAALIATGIIVPPITALGSYYGLWPNFAIVFAAVTVLRLLFFSSTTPWLRPLYMKGVVIVAAVPLFLFTVLTMNDVQTLIDSQGYQALFTTSASEDLVTTWGRYVRNEVIFFGTSLLLLLALLPFVMLVQGWRQVKARQRGQAKLIA